MSPPRGVSFNDNSRPAGHNRSDSLKNDRPASFKRMLGCAPGEGSSQRFSRMIELCIHITVCLSLREVVRPTNSETQFIIVNPEFDTGALEVQHGQWGAWIVERSFELANVP